MAKAATCLKCGREGHLARDCTAPATCTKCGLLGHIAELCEIQARIKHEAAPVDEGRGRNGSQPICRRCGRKGHLGRKCTFVDAKCAVCGEAGHFAKDCKGRGGSFFLKASKVMEGKDFAKQQAAMRLGERWKKTEQVMSRTSTREEGAPAGPRPTDMLLEGANSAAAGKSSGLKVPKMAIRVVAAGGKRGRDQMLAQAKPSGPMWLTVAERQETQHLSEKAKQSPMQEVHLSSLLAGYGSGSESDSDSGQNVQKGGSNGRESDVSPEKKHGRLMVVGTQTGPGSDLPDAEQLLGEGRSGQALVASGSSRPAAESDDAWMAHVGRKQSEEVSKRRSELEKKYRVIEMKRIGRSMLGEEIELRVGQEAGALLGRSVVAIQRQTGTTITTTTAGSNGTTFRISRRPGSGDEAVRLAASTLREGLEALVDMMSQLPTTTGGIDPMASRVVRGVTFCRPFSQQANAR